ncbi:MAG: fasciclin domain-containing protein [Myxococcales bacterium]
MIIDLIQTAAEAGNFKRLTAALRTADLISTLEGPGPYTVFAPTDAAFARVPKATMESLLADKEKLTGVLLFHVLAGKVDAHAVGQMRDGDKVKTVSGKDLTLGLKGEVITLNGANVTTRDMQARNGVMHAVDNVIMPS